MFSPIYYLIIGIAVTMLQLSWKRRIYCISFFTMLLLSPDVRLYLRASPEDYYILSSISFLFWVFVLEKNRMRLFLFSVGTIIASYYPNIKFIQIGAVEMIVFGMMWHTYLDVSLNKWKKEIERKIGCDRIIKKLAIPSYFSFRRCNRHPDVAEQLPARECRREANKDC